MVFQKDTEQIVATLKGHTKKVTGVVYHPKEVGSVAVVTNIIGLSIGCCNHFFTGYDCQGLGGGVSQLSADYQGVFASMLTLQLMT